MLGKLFIGLKHCAVSQENLDSLLRHRAVSQGDLKVQRRILGHMFMMIMNELSSVILKRTSGFCAMNNACII